jgi:hypothetical protein
VLEDIRKAIAGEWLSCPELNPSGKVDVPCTRSLKTIRPYRPTGARPRTYSGVFPWSIQEHWRQLEKAPARAARNIARKVSGVQDRQDATMRLLHPKYIKTKAELRTVRTTLHALLLMRSPTVSSCSGGFMVAASQTVAQRRVLNQFSRGYLPLGLEYMLTSGVTMRLLFLDMLIEPVFGDDGALEKFAALDPHAAWEEMKRITGDTADLSEKYRSYMDSVTEVYV